MNVPLFTEYGYVASKLSLMVDIVKLWVPKSVYTLERCNVFSFARALYDAVVLTTALLALRTKSTFCIYHIESTS